VVDGKSIFWFLQKMSQRRCVAQEHEDIPANLSRSFQHKFNGSHIQSQYRNFTLPIGGVRPFDISKGL
jgi:hypothetical protein